MTTTVSAGKHSETMWWLILLPWLLSLLISGLCYVAAGPTLGLFFGTFLLATLIVPVLQSGDGELRRAASVAVGTCAGAGIVWSYAATGPDVYLGDCARSLLVLASYILA